MHDQLASFIREQRADTDIFCFQEADGPVPTLCRELLENYNEVTAHKFVTKDDDFYQAMYVKKNLVIKSSGALLQELDNVGLGLYAVIATEKSGLVVCNVHGMSRPIDKRDTPERFQQVQGLVDFAKAQDIPVIIGGDFNVFPSNESIKLFQKNGFKDLISDFKITNTRNHYVWDRYPENPRQYYSDYVFVSSALAVNAFSAPAIEVSDHEPLLLEVTVPLLSRPKESQTTVSLPIV